MSQRHLFESADGLVNKALRGMITYNHALALDEATKVVFDTAYDKSKVSLVSGGGAGHEPAWTGFVGENMLTASVSGDIFASPSTKQILAGIRAVPSDKGTILVVTNYTGDCLHFGLANEKATAAGYNCRMIICGDDISIPKKKGSLVGRRGLAGQLAVVKFMGGASGAGKSLDEVYDLGVAVSQQIATIAATLDHCHVPGRPKDGAGALAADEVELGTGPHNEPGFKKFSPQPSADELVKMILDQILNDEDPERQYVKFNPGDETILLISNFGGMSVLEMSALVDEVLNQLARDWKFEPIRTCYGITQSSLNAPAFSVSLINISAAAKACSFSIEEINTFFDAKTTTHWESMTGRQSQRRTRQEQLVTLPTELEKVVEDSKDLKVDPAILKSMLQKACENIITAEPDITRWDTVMGDGDCGETLKTGAVSMLSAIDKATANGSILEVLHELEEIVESKMGGTLGGILGIFFVALRNGVEQNINVADSEGVAQVWARALGIAIDNLRRYTPAKIGDRTVMDTLIPFADGMKSGSFKQGVDAAIKGAENTKLLQPKLGRATYVGGMDTGKELPPDPGAWGVMVAIQGLAEGL